MRRLSLLLLAAIGLPAAEVTVAQWGAGSGTLAGAPAAVAAKIDTNQVVAASDKPVRLELAGFPGSDVILRPDSALRFTVEDKQLVIELERGAVQVDVTGTGPWSGLTVRGGSVEARVTGTLFVVERSEQRGDFVALVRGKLNVRLRREVAEALGGNQSTDLTSRQGIGGGPGGLGALTGLTNRPQITITKSIADQGTGAKSGDGGWNEDDGGDATGDTPDSTETPAPDAPEAPDLTEEVVDEVLADLPTSAPGTPGGSGDGAGDGGVVGDAKGTSGAGATFSAPPPPPPAP